MKICLLNVLHDALDKRMYHKVARSLVAAGHEVVSIAPGTGAAPDGVTLRLEGVASKARALEIARSLEAARSLEPGGAGDD